MADLKTLMEDIARAIRLKTGNSDKINAQDFPQKIKEISQEECSSFFIDVMQADEIKITPEINPDVNVKLSLEGMKAEIIGENIQNTIINERIKSTGTQYIDIGYTPNENTRLIITLSDIISPTGSDNNILFSATNIWDYSIFCLTYQTSGFRWMASNTHFKSGQYSPKATIELYRDFIKYNDEIVQELNSKGYNYKNLNTLRLFGGIRFQDPYAHTQGYTLYSLQIYENDILLYDLIPRLSTENNHLNEAALFDKISQQYFYNQGTGELKYEKEDFIGVPVGSLIEVVSDDFDINSCDIQWRDINQSGTLSPEEDSSFEPIFGATSKFYTVQNNNKILSCKLTGRGEYYSQIVTDSIKVIENENDISE